MHAAATHYGRGQAGGQHVVEHSPDLGRGRRAALVPGGHTAACQERGASGALRAMWAVAYVFFPPTPCTCSCCPVLMCSAMMVLKVEAAGRLLKAGAQSELVLSHTAAIQTDHVPHPRLPSMPPSCWAPRPHGLLTCGARRAARAQHFMEDSQRFVAVAHLQSRAGPQVWRLSVFSPGRSATFSAACPFRPNLQVAAVQPPP